MTFKCNHPSSSSRAKISRVVIAIITGYLFSSIPMDFVFKSDIDSYLLEHDAQISSINEGIRAQINSIEDKQWFKTMTNEELAVARTGNQLENERMGKGITGHPNRPGKKSPEYDKIDSEYRHKQANLEKIRLIYKSDLEHRESLKKQQIKAIDQIQAANPSNHIKRHIALWSYAFSSLGTAFFFISCLLLFWCVDSLAVLISFLNENEYLNNVEKHNTIRIQAFSSSEFMDKFKPIIASNTL